MARSWRNEGLPAVPVEVQQRRILALVAKRWKAGHRDGIGLSSLGEFAFEGRRFSRAQGAALAVSKTVRGMVDSGLLRYAGFDEYGYKVTPQGLRTWDEWEATEGSHE